MEQRNRWDRAIRELQSCAGEWPLHPFALARMCRLHLHARRRSGALLRGQHVYFDRDATPAEQRRLVAECVARYVLRRHRVKRSRAAIRHVASALALALPSSAAAGF